MLGTYALSAGYYDAYYGQAQRVRTLIIRDFARAYEQYDALLSPTSPTVAFELGAKSADPLAMYLSDVCTIPTNLAGHAAISVPYGAGEGGLADRRAGAGAGAGRAGDVPRGAGAGGVGMSVSDEQTDVRAGHRARGALRAVDRDQVVLRLPQRVRRRAQHPRVPGVPRAPGFAAGAQRAGRRVRACGSPRPCTCGCPSSRRSRARTTSIPTCRRTTRSRSTTSRSRSTAGSTSTAARVGIERAHLEEDTGKTRPRRRRRSHPRGRPLARRLQPRRRAAHGDREPARHPERRAGARLRDRAARRCCRRSACPT